MNNRPFRDYVAVKAMAALIVEPDIAQFDGGGWSGAILRELPDHPRETTQGKLARVAYAIADAMINERGMVNE